VENNQAPGIARLVGRLARTGIGAVQNRFELLALEWQEERVRLAELLVWIAGLLFLGMMSAILLTAIIIYLCPQDIRIYAAAGFALLYIIGVIVAVRGVKTLLRREAFAESVEQAKRDRAWLKSFD
jgi:uncharacterized membrane protein YqjE